MTARLRLWVDELDRKTPGTTALNPRERRRWERRLMEAKKEMEESGDLDTE